MQDLDLCLTLENKKIGYYGHFLNFWLYFRISNKIINKISVKLFRPSTLNLKFSQCSIKKKKKILRKVKKNSAPNGKQKNWVPTRKKNWVPTGKKIGYL